MTLVEAILQKLEEEKESYESNPENSFSYFDIGYGIGEAIDVVKECNKNHSDWIPARELPKKKEDCEYSEEVLIQSSWKDLYVGRYDFREEEWSTEGFCFDKEVVAWQPLPKPYEHTKENKK